MAARIEFIKSPSTGTIEFLKRRMDKEGWQRLETMEWDSVLLIQDALPTLLFLTDKAEKASNVLVEEIRGTCPQHISMAAIFGKTSAVQAALEAVNSILSSSCGE